MTGPKSQSKHQLSEWTEWMEHPQYGYFWSTYTNAHKWMSNHFKNQNVVQQVRQFLFLKFLPNNSSYSFAPVREFWRKTDQNSRTREHKFSDKFQERGFFEPSKTENIFAGSWISPSRSKRFVSRACTEKETASARKQAEEEEVQTRAAHTWDCWRCVFLLFS